MKSLILDSVKAVRKRKTVKKLIHSTIQTYHPFNSLESGYPREPKKVREPSYIQLSADVPDLCMSPASPSTMQLEKAAAKRQTRPTLSM